MKDTSVSLQCIFLILSRMAAVLRLMYVRRERNTGNKTLIYYEVSKGRIQVWICSLLIEYYKVRLL